MNNVQSLFIGIGELNIGVGERSDGGSTANAVPHDQFSLNFEQIRW